MVWNYKIGMFKDSHKDILDFHPPLTREIPTHHSSQYSLQVVNPSHINLWFFLALSLLLLGAEMSSKMLEAKTCWLYALRIYHPQTSCLGMSLKRCDGINECSRLWSFAYLVTFTGQYLSIASEVWVYYFVWSWDAFSLLFNFTFQSMWLNSLESPLCSSTCSLQVRGKTGAGPGNWSEGVPLGKYRDGRLHRYG